MLWYFRGNAIRGKAMALNHALFYQQTLGYLYAVFVVHSNLISDLLDVPQLGAVGGISTIPQRSEV